MPGELKAIRVKLAKLIESCNAGKSEHAPAKRPYRLTIAFFPLILGS